MDRSEKGIEAYVQQLLDEAAQFAKGDECQAAVARARFALVEIDRLHPAHDACATELAARAAFAIERYRLESAAWNRQIEARRDAYFEREMPPGKVLHGGATAAP
ncbi:MAG TPA: hypothetical protein VJT73_17095 [Polyangiaceae bacterium]|nr:hypothetical protein [Polyangiaceae bacterium]